MTKQLATWTFAAATALAASLHSSPPAAASSEAAWQDFRIAVETACRDIARDRMEIGAIRVDPFGTESYGVAILTEAGSGGGERVCVYDKQTGRTELGGPVEAPEPPAGPLAPSDAAELRALPAQVRATLDALRQSNLPLNEQAELAETLLADGAQAGPLSGIEPGPYACSVYWYGFLDAGAARMGTHKCAVERGEDGALAIRKFTGERMNARILSLDDNRTAYAGRKFLTGHRNTGYDPETPANPENDNFGNKVGLVLQSGDRLLLVSVDERGMAPPDPTWFEVLELVPQP